MANTVEVILSTKDAQTVRAWQNYKNNIAAVDAQLAKLDTTQKKNTASAGEFNRVMEAGVNQVAGIASGWFGIQAAVAQAVSEVENFLEANAKAAKSSEDAAKRQERDRKRIQVQSGQGPLAAEEAQGRLRTIAQETATSNADMTDIATMLLSSGADVKTATGGGAKSIAEFVKAQALKGNQVNTEQFTDSITAFLAGQGKDLNDETIGTLVKQLQSQGIKETKFKIPDLKYWAQEAQSLQKVGGMSQEDILALAGATSGAVGAEHGARQVREIVKNLAVAGSQPDRVKALKEIGLKPEDVDMKGEGYDVAIERIRKGLDKIPEGKRAGILNKLVEGANIGEFYAIAEGVEKISKVKQGLGDSKAYEQDVKTMTTGRDAAETRLQNSKENIDADRQGYSQLYRDAFEAAMKEDKSISNWWRERRLEAYDSNIKAGRTPEFSINASGGVFSGIVDTFAGDVNQNNQIAAEAERKFKSALGGDEQAAELRRKEGVDQGLIPIDNAPATPGPNATPEEVRKFEAFHARRRGAAPAAAQPATSEPAPVPIVQVNTQVVMPGGAAPTRPVAAAGIKGRRT